jgi:hypothetical protein
MAGTVFQGLDCAEKVAEADFVALGINRIDQPLVDRRGDGLLSIEIPRVAPGSVTTRAPDLSYGRRSYSAARS